MHMRRDGDIGCILYCNLVQRGKQATSFSIALFTQERSLQRSSSWAHFEAENETHIFVLSHLTVLTANVDEHFQMRPPPQTPRYCKVGSISHPLKHWTELIFSIPKSALQALPSCSIAIEFNQAFAIQFARKHTNIACFVPFQPGRVWNIADFWHCKSSSSGSIIWHLCRPFCAGYFSRSLPQTSWCCMFLPQHCQK